jgi:hypothetical protein
MNSPDYDFDAPVAAASSRDYGREYDTYGMDELTELKAIVTQADTPIGGQE